MRDVFEVLGHDHTEVKQMLVELETSAPQPGQHGRELREKMVEQLIIEASKHEAVEEEYFWPAVRELVDGGDELADTATEQEQAAKYVLNDLIDLDADDPRFEELVTQFIHDGRAHIAYEEEQVWPRLRRVITEDRAQELGRQLEDGKRFAPTRPHPHTPPSPGILKTTGPVVSAMDKARDKLTGRDKD